MPTIETRTWGGALPRAREDDAQQGDLAAEVERLVGGGAEVDGEVADAAGVEAVLQRVGVAGLGAGAGGAAVIVAALAARSGATLAGVGAAVGGAAGGGRIGAHIY